MNRIILVSMVRNEEKIISRMIRSALPLVDGAVIVDTGSTDNTKSCAETAINGSIPFAIFDCEWKDFGHNRTLAIRAGKSFIEDIGWDSTRCWLLLLDADHILKSSFNSKDVVVFPNSDSVRIFQFDGDLRYQNVRLLRASANARYIGRTHEYVSVEGSSSTIETIWIEDKNDGGFKSDKFPRDLNLLSKDWNEKQNGRTAFYIAQTHRYMGNWSEALKWYGKRINMAAPHEEEEAWYSVLCRARCLLGKKDILAAKSELSKAFVLRPWRAESLHDLAKICLDTMEHKKAHSFAKLGLSISLPLSESLFVEKTVYEWGFRFDLAISSYYVGDTDEGARQCEYLRTTNGSPHKSWALENVTFYIKKLPSKIIDIKFNPEPGWSACNPSIVKFGDKYAIVVRTVNYKINPGHLYESDSSGKIKTRNFLLIVDMSFSVESSVELETPTGYPSSVEGLEDVRIYDISKESITALANRSDWDFAPDGFSRLQPRMKRCSWSFDGKSISTESINVSPEHVCEKNWLPFVFAGQHLAVYWHSPFKIINLDTSDTVHEKTFQSVDLGGFRGSSSPIPWDNGWLYTIHEVCQRITDGKNKFYYMHRFCWMALGGSLEKFSNLFYFDTLGVEFCSGMAEHQDGVAMTFGVHDCLAKIAIVSAETIREYLSHHLIKENP